MAVANLAVADPHQAVGATVNPVVAAAYPAVAVIFHRWWLWPN